MVHGRWKEGRRERSFRVRGGWGEEEEEEGEGKRVRGREEGAG